MSIVHVTTHDKEHKLAGIESVSTSVVENKICQARRKDTKSVCAKCYAEALVNCRVSLGDHLRNNYNILNAGLIPTEKFYNLFSTVLGRIESFGDCASLIQGENYTRMIKANPETHFAIWSKNYAFYFKVWDRVGKPGNTTFVLSSSEINVPFDMSKLPEKWRGYVDHVFTVWDIDKYPLHDMAGHCAGVRCMSCQKCYHNGTPFYINECLRTRSRANIQFRREHFGI